MAHKLKLNSPVGADALILKWPVPTSEGKDGPEEVLDTIRLVCEDFPELKTTIETRILKDGSEDVSNYDYEQTKAMCERYNKAIDSYRQLVKGQQRQRMVSKQVSMKQLKHILQQCYNHSVKDPEKLNHYEPFSPEVYGETSFELVEQMIKYVQFSECDYFIDLGSGVGQVVLQVSAATNCKFCYGVEKAEWPAEYAAGMEREFRKWMKWYGKEHGEFKIEKGDFLHDSIKEKLNKATIVFVNNFAFGPVVDHELKQRFANCLKEGARIVSSKAFCPLNFRITARNLSDIGTIMQVEELSPLCGAVSWTGKPFAYYVHTIDRTLLEKYFNRLRHPSKKDEIEPRKDRKGRPLLSIRDKINGALSGGSDSNSSGRWRRIKGQLRDPEIISPLSAAKVLDFDSGSNSSYTNSGGVPTVDESSIVYGPTTRRQWNEYVKRPQSQCGTENDNDSSAADVANVDLKSQDQTEETIQKKKKMKTVKRLNNGALGKRQMQVGKKIAEPVKSKAALKLRPRQKQLTRSSTIKRGAIATSVASITASVSTTTSSVPSNVTAHTNGTVSPPSLDSLNLLHAHTVMSTSGQDHAEKVNYNDRRMTETLSAYFKPTVQKQTVSNLEKEAGFLQMIETMKQRFLSFLTFMQSPEYRAMLLLQIEQEKMKNTNLKSQSESLEKDISLQQKEGVRLIKERLKEMGIKADTPRELISQAKDIMLRHHELKSQTASLGAQINALQNEHNHKITAHRKVLDRKLAMQHSENNLNEHTYHMVNKEYLDQQKLLLNINRLHAEIQHLQNVNKSYVSTKPEAGVIGGDNLDTGLGLLAEEKGVIKCNSRGRTQVNLYTKEKFDMKENYEAFGTVLAMVKKEVTAALQNSSTPQNIGQVSKLDTGHVSIPTSIDARQDTTDNSINTDDIKSNKQSWCSNEVIKNAQSNTGQSFKGTESIVEEIEGSTHMPQVASSWTTDVRKEGAVTSTSPRILPAGMKIDIKKPSRLNGLNSTLKTKVSQSNNYTILQNSNSNHGYKTANGSFTKVPTFNLYTENEKSAAEDLIALKDILSTPVTSIEHQDPVLNKSLSSSSSLLSKLSNLEYVQNHITDSKASIMQHSSYDKSTVVAQHKPYIGSSKTNSLSKDSSISCAITPVSSTSHVFAQVPIANFNTTGSNNQFVSQSCSILGTSSIQVRSGSQSKVNIATSLPKNGLVKHKNLDSTIIHRPVKVRTIEGNVPSILSSAFYAQAQQQIAQAPSLNHSSGGNVARVIKSDPGHLVSNQPFLNAHLNKAVVVSSSSSTVGSSLPFLTIQSPHAIPASSGSNGVQPSLIKILQQKPIVITPKGSTLYNGTTNNNNNCNGSLIAVSSPTISSQGSLIHHESIPGQAVKLLPPNGTDAKGCLHSPETCSVVASEFDEFVADASQGGTKCEFQECDKFVSSPVSEFECLSEISEELTHNNSCSDEDFHSDTQTLQFCCHSSQFHKCKREFQLNISSKLSTDSDISSPDNTNCITRSNQVLCLEREPTATKRNYFTNEYSNSLSVILKRETHLEKMAESISDGENRRMSKSKYNSLVLKELGKHVHAKPKLQPIHLGMNNSQHIFSRPVHGSRTAENSRSTEHTSDAGFVKSFRKRHLHRKSSSTLPQLEQIKRSRNAGAKMSSAAGGKLDNNLSYKDQPNVRRLRPNHGHCSKSHLTSHKHSVYKNKALIHKNTSNEKDDFLSSSSGPKIVSNDNSLPDELLKKNSFHCSCCSLSEENQQNTTQRQENKCAKSKKYITLKRTNSKYCCVETNNCAIVSSEEKVQCKSSKSGGLKQPASSARSVCEDHSHLELKSSKSCHQCSSPEELVSLSSAKKRTDLSENKPTKECLDVEKVMFTNRRQCEESTSRSLSRSSSVGKNNSSSVRSSKRHSLKQKAMSHSTSRSLSRSSSVGKSNSSSVRSSKRHSLKQKAMSPGPPKLKRAISPPNHQRRNKMATKLPHLPSKHNFDNNSSDSDSKNNSFWGEFFDNSEKRTTRDSYRQNFKTQTIPKESSMSTIPDNSTNSKSHLSSEHTRNYVTHKQKLPGEKIRDKNLSNKSKKTFGITTRAIKPLPRPEFTNKTHANDKSSIKYVKVHGKFKTVKSSRKNTSINSVGNMSKSKHIINELDIKKQTGLKDDDSSPDSVQIKNTRDHVETFVHHSTVRQQHAKSNNEEGINEFVPNNNIGRPYGMLTPKSVSRNCQGEENRQSESLGSENHYHNDKKHCQTHELKLDFDIQDEQLKIPFACPSEEAVNKPEGEIVSLPPTPGKTLHTLSLPCSPISEINVQQIDEPDGKVSEQASDSVSGKKGPQTPPGSPLFNHESRSRSRSPSISSSSSRCSSFDSCHSTSSTSSLSDCSSDDTKKRKRKYQHHKTPPRKLSTLILPTTHGISTPPKAAVLYSPMPSPNLNGFTYGTQIRPGLSSTTVAGFGNYGIPTSALSPLSVSTQQSPGYQMVTSDSLRSPNGLLRSPVSGSMMRQHSVFPSPASSSSSSTSTTVSSSATNKNDALHQQCKPLNSIVIGGDNKNSACESVLPDRDKPDNVSSVKAKSTSSNISASMNSHTVDISTTPYRMEGSSALNSHKSKYKPLDSGDIIKDHNANNTSFSSHPSTHLQEAPIDYNQNLCLLSTSCCSTSKLAPTNDATKINLAPEPESTLNSSQFNIDIKSAPLTVGSFLSQDNLVDLGIENTSYRSTLKQPIATITCSPSVTATNHCMLGTDSIITNINDGLVQTASNSYLTCNMQHQPQEMLYLNQSKSNPSNITDHNRLTPQTKQPPTLTQPQQQHLPSFPQTQTLQTSVPNHQLYVPRQTRQKGPSGYPPNIGNYSTHSYQTYKGQQNFGIRRAGYGNRFSSSHYPAHWSNVNSQVYTGRYSHNTSYYSSKTRSGPHLGQCRDTADASLTEHMHNGLANYTLNGALTHPYVTEQWNNATPQYYMGSGAGGLGRPVHQHYNHPNHNKHH